MVRESWVQSQVASYQRLEKWYLIPPCLTLSKIRYVSRVKLSNSGKEIAPSPTPWCSSYWKGNLLVALDYGCQLYLLIYIDRSITFRCVKIQLASSKIWTRITPLTVYLSICLSFFINLSDEEAKLGILPYNNKRLIYKTKLILILKNKQ